MSYKPVFILLLLALAIAAEAPVIVDCASGSDARQIKTVVEMTARRLDLLLERDILSGETLKNESAIIIADLKAKIAASEASTIQRYETIIFKINTEKWLLVTLTFFSVTINIWFWYLLMGRSIQKAQRKISEEVLKRRQEIQDKLDKAKPSKRRS